MTNFGSLLTFWEVVIASCIFLYSAPRRSRFALRGVLGLIGFSLLAYFYPLSSGEFLKWSVLLRQIVLYTFTIILILVCFDVKSRSAVALAFAGVAVQGVAYSIIGFLSYIPAFAALSVPFLSSAQFKELLVCPVVYVALWAMFGRVAARTRYYESSDPVLDVLAVTVVVVNVIITRIPYLLNEYAGVSVAIYGFVMNALALVIQFAIYYIGVMHYESQLHAQMWREERRQYEITKETIEAINIKCHDLKHRLGKISLNPSDVDETKDLIRIYDNSVKTGNEVIDLLLMDYTLRSGKEHITYTIMGDGKLLSFMSEDDLYSLFGNAFENATEAVKKVEEAKRTVGITIESCGDLVVVNVRNYFSGELKMDGDLPATSKTYEKGSHGFGIKSMRRIVKKYGGKLTIGVRGDVFTLGVSFMRE